MESFYNLVNAATAPWYVLTAVPTLLVIVLIWRDQLTKPAVFWGSMVLLLLFLIVSMGNRQFRSNTTLPDNIPILSMLFLIPFFTWLSLRKAVVNDQRIAAGKPTWEEENKDEVYVWPDLVYAEFLAGILFMVLLIVWSIMLKAPLESPADPSDSPNPSKAPWYFLGLQEMLVYFDPWIAGVVMPLLIIVGLCAIPYLDFNPRGRGYYTFRERKFAIVTFLMGFVVFWITLILIGTFLRGPNWNFFGPYEPWTTHKVEVLNNVNLSEIVWIGMLDKSLPGGSIPNILLRELPGLLLLGAYFVVLPPLLAFTVLKYYYRRMGFIRYNLMMTLMLFWLFMVIKMITRWFFNLKYVVAIPEWFFNI